MFSNKTSYWAGRRPRLDLEDYPWRAWNTSCHRIRLEHWPSWLSSLSSNNLCFQVLDWGGLHLVTWAECVGEQGEKAACLALLGSLQRKTIWLLWCRQSSRNLGIQNNLWPQQRPYPEGDGERSDLEHGGVQGRRTGEEKVDGVQVSFQHHWERVVPTLCCCWLWGLQQIGRGNCAKQNREVK